MNEYVRVASILGTMMSKHRHLEDCFDPDERPLVQQICYGVVRYYWQLDDAVGRFLKKPLAAKHADIRFLIMAGIYSIDHLKRPAHASVNAAVTAANKLGKGWARGLVNGVLRNYIRKADSETAANDSLEVRWNHPAWLIEQIAGDWQQYESILTANNSRAPMTLRVNTRHTSREAYLALLKEKGIDAHAGQLSPLAIYLAQPVPVASLPGFTGGMVSVQDEAPQLAPGFLDLAPGLKVLDACAAPGGKTTGLLEAADVTVTAIDHDKKRIQRISDNLQRASLEAEVLCEDLLEFSPATTFDRILLDAPCSATGIIRRHPDIKLLRTKGDIDKLLSVQRGLLNKAFELLGTGGELIYCTCSILASENDGVVSDFLSGHPEAALTSLSHPLADTHPQIVSTTYGLQFLPTQDAHDGFYYSGIRKIAAVETGAGT